MAKSTVDDEWVFARVADERRAMATVFDSLTEDQWSTASLCDAWTVRDMAAHLTMPLVTSTPTVLLALLKARGNFDKANVALTDDVARRHGRYLPQLLHTHAGSRFTPPSHGPLAPLTEITVHGLDVRTPLGLTRAADPEITRAVLDFLTTPAALRYRPTSASPPRSASAWALMP